jgi:hypothetical protein
MRRRYLCGALVGVLATAGALTISWAASAAPAASNHLQARTSVMRPLGFKSQKPLRPTRTNNLSYRGGVGGIGVETAPKVYLVLWGSQWNGNDPSGELLRRRQREPVAGQRHAVLPGRGERHGLL